MSFDYFSPAQAEQFAFYRIPKVLFTDEQFKPLSVGSKVLYGLFLDRVALSLKNGWVDEANHVYIIYTLDEIMEALGCSDKPATKMMVELEGIELIERKKQGLGKPALIYVKNFASGGGDSRSENVRFKTRNISDSGLGESTAPDSENLRRNKTNNNNTDLSETDPFSSGSVPVTPVDNRRPRDTGRDEERMEMQKRADYRRYFEEQISYDILLHDNPYDEEELEEILEILVDTCCTKRQMIRVAGDDKPAEVVKSRLMKLDSEHIRYVISCMKENTTKVRNIKQYLLATLYNAPLTIGNYYSSLVRHDMAMGFAEGR